MNNKWFVGAVIALSASLTARPATAGPVSIDFGVTECGTISFGEVDGYSFDGSAGDVIWIRMVESPETAGLEPRLRLLDPGGINIAVSIDTNLLSDILDFTLPATGTYTVEAFDAGDDDAGNYCIHVQRVSSPGNATGVGFGPVNSGSITSIADINAFTFDADAGDVTWIRLVELDAALDPRVRLYRPDGTLLAISSNNNLLSDFLDLTLPDTGTYTIIVYDQGSEEVGDYLVHLQRINAPTDAVPAEFGPVQGGSIPSIADMSAFTFDANAGEVIWIRLVESDAILEPRIRLYRPDASLLAVSIDNNLLSDIIDLSLPETGTYTMLIYDAASDEVGDYLFHMQRITEPNDAEPVDFGPVHDGSLTSVAEVNAFSFDASAGDVIWIRLVETVAAIEPRLRLYKPDGSLLALSSDTNQLSDFLDLPLPDTGTYTMLVYDLSSDEIGDYLFHMQRITEPNDAVAAEFGPVQGGSITSIAEVNAFTFDANAGDEIWIRLVESDAVLEPRIRLYRPDASLLAVSTDNNLLSDIIDLSLPDTGTYTMLIYDGASDEMGDYLFHMQRITEPNDAVPVEFGPVHGGSIASIAEVNAFAFEAKAGDLIWIRLAETVPDIEMRARLYGPDATLLALSGDTNVISDFLDVTLPETGTYTMLVYDLSSDELGDYLFHMQRINRPNDAAPIELGPINCASIDSIAEVDAYSFEATEGSSVRVRMIEESVEIEPRLRLYGPDGTVISIATGGPVAQDIGVPITLTGEHTLLAYDASTDETGLYRLEVELCEIDPCPAFCPSDSNNDGVVDVVDLVDLIVRWGLCACCDEDTEGFGAVDVTDLINLISAWGPCF